MRLGECRNKTSARPLRSRRLCGEFLLQANSPRRRRGRRGRAEKNRFSDRLLASAKPLSGITPSLTVGLLLCLFLHGAALGSVGAPVGAPASWGAPASCQRAAGILPALFARPLPRAVPDRYTSNLYKALHAIPQATLLSIIRAEDERRYNDDLARLLSVIDPHIRRRAALAAGRIGDERAVPALMELLQKDSDIGVRQMAAFALGQVGSPAGADALLTVLGLEARPSGRAATLNQLPSDQGRARAVEALGKIAEALAKNPASSSGANSSDTSKTEDPRLRVFREAILYVLTFEWERRPAPDRMTVLLGLTAALHAKPDGAGPVIARFLSFSDARIRAHALNALARLKLKDGNERAREMLMKDSDPIVRANAARALGAAEDKQAFDGLLDRALHDDDLRVRVSAIRALGALKDERAAIPLSKRGAELFRLVVSFRFGRLTAGNGTERNEGLEILSALGLILTGKKLPAIGEEAAARIELSLRVRAMTNENIPEEEIALAREVLTAQGWLSK